MGCGNSKRTGYSDFEYDEEVEIRKFEEEMGGFKKPLNRILQRVIIEQDIINKASVDEMALQDFSEYFLNLIHQGYFYTMLNERQYYDAKKIKLFLFLLSDCASISNGKVNYYDKASFIFNYIKVREDEDLSSPIEEENENLNQFLNDLVDIACEGEVDSYITLKGVKRDGLLKNLKLIKKEIVARLLEVLFGSASDSTSRVLSFDDLNKKFSDNKYLFTSGDVREIGWKILSSGKANELAKAEAELAAKEGNNQ